MDEESLVPILYASQTGNCQFIAREISRKYLNCYICELDEFNIETINSYKYILFIVSTHGEGQPPFNGSKFYDTLYSMYELVSIRKKRAVFKFQYSILGLGDSSFLHFCQFANNINTLLTRLGATKHIIEFADAMEKNGFYDGLNRFLSSIPLRLHITSSSNTNIFYINRHKFNVTATIISNTKISSTKFSNIYELIFKLDKKVSFIPGECIGIIPKNTGIKYVYDNFDNNLNMQQLIDHFDLYSIPHWPIFHVLYQVALDHNIPDIYKNKLKEIAEDYELYYYYVYFNKKTIFSILQDFHLDNVKNLNQCLPYLNLINPRYYSYSKLSHDQYSILYNVQSKKGLCTSFLSQLYPNTTLNIKITDSKLFFNNKKLLFFCTGTGFTLPRSVILSDIGIDKKIIVYYGHRYKEQDCLAKDVYPPNTTIICVHSRDDKMYIQDKFEKDWDINENIDEWLIFVSGNYILNKEINTVLQKMFNKTIPFQSETW